MLKTYFGSCSRRGIASRGAVADINCHVASSHTIRPKEHQTTAIRWSWRFVVWANLPEKRREGNKCGRMHWSYDTQKAFCRWEPSVYRVRIPRVFNSCSHGNLWLSRPAVRKPRVERHLKKYHPDILSSITSLLTELKAGKTRKPDSQLN